MSISQDEGQKAWYKGMHKFHHGIFTGIKVCYLASVIKYDKKKHIADILPLANTSDGEKSAQYLEVPVSKNCYAIDDLIAKIKASNAVGGLPSKPYMRKGVVVVVVVLDKDCDNWNGKAATFMPNSSRLHDANDSIIVGVM